MSESVGVAARQNLLDVLGHMAEEKVPRADAELLLSFSQGELSNGADFCERYALHPSFVMLFSSLSGGLARPKSPEYWSTLGQFIAGVADDTDTSKLVGGWVSDVWEQLLRARISDTELRSACDRASDLHRRTNAGETISRQDWRACRKAIEMFAAKVGGDDAMWARVIAAGAWDVELIPAVGVEVLNAWSSLISSYLQVDTDQTPEEIKVKIDHGQKLLAELKSQGVALLVARSKG